MMKILVACEFSGIVREAFRKRGHDAWSCDLLDSELPGNHIKGDVMNILGDGWDLMVAHPPCTFLTVTGNRWFLPQYVERFPTRNQDRADAVAFFLAIANSDITRIAIENPVGIMSKLWRKPDQYIHPFMFGDPERKKTGLWLKGLPLLTPTNVVNPRIVTYKNGTGTDSPWHMNTISLPPLERMKARSVTFPGIAEAMAEQWGNQGG